MTIRDKNFRYVATSWQGLIQQVSALASRGYARIHVTYYPEEKQNIWERIDTKIYRKYHANLTRAQVDYRRKQKQKVYKFLRWENVMVLMSTDEDDHPRVVEDDKFLDLKTGQQKIQIGEHLSFIIYFDERQKYTFRVGNETLEYWKSNVTYHAGLKHKKELLQEIWKINFVPPYSGVCKQKQEILKYIKSEIKRHGVPFSSKEIKNIHFNSRRKQVKVFEE